MEYESEMRFMDALVAKANEAPDLDLEPLDTCYRCDPDLVWLQTPGLTPNCHKGYDSMCPA